MSRIVGRYPSRKLKRMVSYQSHIERDFIYLLEFHEAVNTYKEQPLTIVYMDGGKTRRYTPDFYMECSGQGYLIECKHHEYLQVKKNRVKWQAATEWCLQEGMLFHVVTGQQMRVGYRLQNVKLLLEHSRYVVNDDIRSAIMIALLSLNRSCQISSLISEVRPENPQSLLLPVLHMIYEGRLTTSLDEAPITVGSWVNLPKANDVPLGLPWPSAEGVS